MQLIQPINYYDFPIVYIFIWKHLSWAGINFQLQIWNFILFFGTTYVANLLTLFQTSPGFYVSAVQFFWNTVGKGEIARNGHFLLFRLCFLPSWRNFCHIHQIQNWHLQTLSVWKSLKFVVCKRVNQHANVSFGKFDLYWQKSSRLTLIDI